MHGNTPLFSKKVDDDYFRLSAKEKDLCYNCLD